MSSGPRGEEPINLDLNRRLHYLRLLRLHRCRPLCDRCREARGVLIAAGVPINPDKLRESAQTPGRAKWEWPEISLFFGLLVLTVGCLVLTVGRNP